MISNSRPSLGKRSLINNTLILSMLFLLSSLISSYHGLNAVVSNSFTRAYDLNTGWDREAETFLPATGEGS